MELARAVLESAAGRSHARGSVGGGRGYKDQRVMGKVDRMEDGRRKRTRSGREQPFIGRPKEDFQRTERRLVPLSTVMERARKTSGFGTDFVIPMGIHGVGTSPSAAKDHTDPTKKYTGHKPDGAVDVEAGGPFGTGSPFDHLPRGKKKPKKRRKR
jgi:hypothetical protein